MRRFLVSAASAALFAFSLLGAANASVVTVTFKGVIDGGFDIADAGDTFTAVLKYESSTPNLGDATFGVFNAIISLNVTTSGGYVGSTTGAPELQIDNNPGGGNHDRFAVIARDTDGYIGPNNGVQIGRAHV